MRRKLFNLAALSSLLAFTVICSLWAASRAGPRSVTATHVIDRPINVGIGDQRTNVEHSVIVDRRSVAWLRWWYHSGGGAPLGWSMTHSRLSSPWSRPWQIHGFGFGYFGHDDESFGRREVAVPVWVIAAALAALPATWLIRWTRRLGDSPTACPTCGYDCRATPEPAREGEALLQTCPECGTELARSKPRATDDQREEPVARRVEG